MKTAIQELIGTFEDLKAGSTKVSDKLYLDATIAILEAKLPTEKVQLCKAYDAGFNHSKTAEQYVKETYNQ